MAEAKDMHREKMMVALSSVVAAIGLTSMKLVVTEDRSGTRPVTNGPSLFGNLMPIPIPKVPVQ